MDISKRNAVRIVSFTVAVVGVLAVRNIQLMSSEKRALRSVSYTYSRAMGDLCDAVENVSDTLCRLRENAPVTCGEALQRSVLGKGGSVTASHRRAAA